MERITSFLLDEWGSLPTGTEPQNELIGVLQSLKAKELPGYYACYCQKSIVIRRFLRLLRQVVPDEIGINKLKDYFCWDNAQKKGQIILPLQTYHAIISAGSLKSPYGRWDWLRGVFGATGSLYIPKTGYYLTIKFFNAHLHKHVVALLVREGYSVNTRTRHQKFEVMLRNQEHVISFLENIGLRGTSEKVKSTTNVRAMKNHANKMVNCDSANINKTLQTAQRQLELLNDLEQRGLLKGIASSLADLVETRRANPSISLRELGLMLPKPVSKSTVEYRWKKIESLLG